MSDREIRELLREVEGVRDGVPWLRLGAALARVKRWDEAGEALVRARARGLEVEGATVSVEDELAPDWVPRVATRGIGAALELGFLTHIAWTPGGRTLLAVAQERTLIAFEGIERGKHRVIAELPGPVSALATDLDGRVLASAGGRLLVLDGTTGEVVGSTDLGNEPAHELAAWGEAGLVFAATRGVGVRAWRYGPGVPHLSSATPSVGIELVHRFQAGCATLASNGAFAAWRSGGAQLYEPLGREPVASLSFRGEGLGVGPGLDSLPSLRAVRRYATRLDRGTLVAGADAATVVAPLAGTPLAFLPFEGGEVVLLAERGTLQVGLEAIPRAAAWAPSGRRLAVALDYRVIIIEVPDDPFDHLEEQLAAAIRFGALEDLFARIGGDHRELVTEWLKRKAEGQGPVAEAARKALRG